MALNSSFRSRVPRSSSDRTTQRRRLLTVAAAAQPAAVISGASSGIGKATAVCLANNGWRVFAGVRSEAAASELSSLNPAIEPIMLDVTRSVSPVPIK